jgi:YfiH family protein
MALPSSNASIRAIDAIDDLFASVGLRHGRRQILSAGYVPQARHTWQQVPAPQAQELARARTVQALKSSVLAAAGVRHGFATRSGGASTVYLKIGEESGEQHAENAGDLNFGFTASDTREHVIENRARLTNHVYGETRPLVTLRQIHSSLMHRVGREHAGEGAVLAGDGMMTDEPGVVLGIQTADCVPVLLADRKRRAVAAFHAGWRGTLARIVERGVGRMRLEFGSDPKDLVAAIGPAIGQCCYPVGENVEHEFRSQFSYADELFREVYDSDPVRKKYPMLFLSARAPGHSNLGPNLHLDLSEANRRQLLAAGVQTEAIEVLGQCTSCRTDLFFSYRAEQGFTGRMLAVIARD